MNNDHSPLFDYKEIVVSITVLILLFSFVILFRLDTVLGVANIITIFAVIVALETAAIATLNNKKVLKQSEINLNRQLLYQDKKKSLFYVLNIANNERSDIFKIENFMSDPESIYLPKNTQNLIKKVFEEINLAYDPSGDEYFDYDEYQNMLKIARKNIKKNVIDNLMNPSID